MISTCCGARLKHETSSSFIVSATTVGASQARPSKTRAASTAAVRHPVVVVVVVCAPGLKIKTSVLCPTPPKGESHEEGRPIVVVIVALMATWQMERNSAMRISLGDVNAEGDYRDEATVHDMVRWLKINIKKTDCQVPCER